MSNIPTREENPNGFHQRYVIKKVVEWNKVYSKNRKGKITGEYMKPKTKDVDKNSEYLTLRLDTGGSDMEHIKAGRIAAHAYADAIEHHLPGVAKDLKEMYPLL